MRTNRWLQKDTCDQSPRRSAAATVILAVGALDRGANGLRVARFSNQEVNLAAPGVDAGISPDGPAGRNPYLPPSPS